MLNVLRLCVHSDTEAELVEQPGQLKGEKMTLQWSDLIEREPRLGPLLEEARSIPRDIRIDRFRFWYHSVGVHESFKKRVYELVGWETDHPDPDMHTSEALHVAAQVILKALLK